MLPSPTGTVYGLPDSFKGLCNSFADVYNHGMRTGRLLSSAMVIWVLGAGASAAEETWSCSVIDEGKPQVIKLKVGKGTVSMSDWRVRLLAKFGIDKTDNTPLRLISDTKEALVAVSDVRVNNEPGTMSDVSMDTVAINKRTGAMTITTASTYSKPEETKGNCAP